jgi:phosphatidylinositol dimannoside acyltransferase
MSHAYRGSGHADAPVDRNPGAVDRIPPGGREATPHERRMGLVWRVVWESARWLPERAAFALADVAGRLAHRVGGAPRRRVTDNLSRLLPAEELDAGVRAAYRSYARYWVEAFRAADIDPGELDRRTTTDGFEHLDGVLEKGGGAIVLLAHHGSWDIAARWAESHRYHLAVVAEVVRPRELFEKFVSQREDIGLEVVPLRRGQNLVGRLSEVLQANHLVGLLTDRDLTSTAPVVEFFGEPCRIPLGPAVLSKRTGTPIVPVTMLQRPGRGWHLQVLPAIDTKDLSVREAHDAVIAALEQLIELDPVQWHAFQPVWLADLPPDKRGEDTAPGAAPAGEASQGAA